jgi:hypothetical protein
MSQWQPQKERRLWPWVLLAIVAVGVVINVTLSLA